MNGLLGWALNEIGFTVTRMAGAVGRTERGEISHGNHLVLRIDLDRPYIADVGFGDGTLEPVALVAGPMTVAGYDFRLEQLDADWWRFHNHALGGMIESISRVTRRGARAPVTSTAPITASAVTSASRMLISLE